MGRVFLMPSPKVKMINVRLAAGVHDDFKTACELRGASMSSLLHQFIVRTIREEKERDPGQFITKGKPIAPTAKTKILKAKTYTQDKRKAQ